MDAYGIIRIIGIVVLLAAASVQCSKIHELRTNDEIANRLRTTGDKMFEYDPAPVRGSRYKRYQNLQRLLTRSGKTIDAYLNPSDGQLFGTETPVWLAFTRPNGTIEYKKMQKRIVGNMISWFNTGHYPSEEEAEAEEEEEEEAEKEEEEGEEKERQIREASRSGNGTDASRVKRWWAEPFNYPTLLVQTDLKGSSMTLNDLDYYKQIIYQLAFWNAVDLRFRDFKYPKIRLRIAGIIIGLDRGATPYVQNHKSDDDIKLWDETRKYWWNMGQREDFPRSAYHIVVTMTDNDAFKPLTGITAQSSCTRPSNKRLHTVAIVRDNGGFEGILETTRTLGILLGLNYDKDSGDECDNSKGFIMQSEFTPGPNSLKWSPCSLNQLSRFLSRSFMHCYDTPAEFHPPGRPVPRLLPGDVLDPEKQCQGRGYHWACDTSRDTCTQLRCYYSGWQALNYGWWCQNTGPAAEGTQCAPGHKCVKGMCQCITKECIYAK